MDSLYRHFGLPRFVQMHQVWVLLFPTYININIYIYIYYHPSPSKEKWLQLATLEGRLIFYRINMHFVCDWFSWKFVKWLKLSDWRCAMIGWRMSQSSRSNLPSLISVYIEYRLQGLQRLLKPMLYTPLTFQRRHFGSFCVRDDAHVSNTIRIEVSLSLIKSWKNMRKNMRKMTRFDLETMTHAVTFLEPFDPPETTEAFGNGDAEPNVNPTISPAGSHPCIQFSVCPDVKLDNFCVPLRCQIFVSAKHCLHPNRTPFFWSKGYGLRAIFSYHTAKNDKWPNTAIYWKLFLESLSLVSPATCFGPTLLLHYGDFTCPAPKRPPFGGRWCKIISRTIPNP